MNFKIDKINISNSRGRFNVVYPLLFALQFLWLLGLASQRYVAPDEGFYLLSAELVTNGKVPYLDFFYPQAPYQPYILSFWFQMFGMSWASARVFSVILFAILGLLIFARIKQTASWGWGLLGVLLLNTSALALDWFLPFKNYGLTVVFLYASYCCLELGKTRRMIFCAGVFLALAIGCRSYVGVLAPLCLLILFLKDQRHVGPFVFGGLIGSIPFFCFLWFGAEAFWFNNLEYHLLRSDWSLEQAIQQKYLIFQGLLGFREAIKFDGWQVPMMLWISILSVLLALFRKIRLDWAGVFSIILFFVSFVPTPSQVQYFVLLIPFLLTTAILFFQWVSRFRFGSLASSLLILFFTCAYFLNLRSELGSFAAVGPGSANRYQGTALVPPHTIFELDALSQRLQILNPEGESLMAIWPGYLFNSKARFDPALSNNFGFVVAPKVSPQARAHLHLVSRREIREMVENGIPYVVVSQRSQDKVASEATFSQKYQLLFKLSESLVYRYVEGP